MTRRSLIFIMLIASATLCGPRRAFASDETQLKSDLELEIEGKATQKAPQAETAKHTRVQAAPVEKGPARPDIETKIELAQTQMKKPDCAAAISTLRPLNDVLPRTGLLILAKAYACQKDSLNELRTLDLCLAKNPKDYVVQTVYGTALIRANRVEDGITHFQEARQLNPRYKPAYEALLRELEKKGERYESRNVVNDMIKIFGPKAEFLTDLCRLYALDDFNEKTIEVCQNAIDKDSSIPENHVYLGLALKNREEIERANSVLTHAAKRFPASEAVQSAMGELYFEKKDYVGSYNYYKRASSADPKSARAWVGYANAAFKLQKNEEALKAYTSACKIDRQQTHDFRLAIGELRVRRDTNWQLKYESAINDCQ